jgi:hypothetical protein
LGYYITLLEGQTKGCIAWTKWQGFMAAISTKLAGKERVPEARVMVTMQAQFK